MIGDVILIAHIISIHTKRHSSRFLWFSEVIQSFHYSSDKCPLFIFYNIVYYSSYHPTHNVSQKRSISEISLDCGRPVSFSFIYDDLIGISLRYNHPSVPDAEVGTHQAIKY